MNPYNSAEQFNTNESVEPEGINADELAAELTASREQESSEALEKLNEHIDHIRTAVAQGDIFLASQWLESLQANITYDADPKHAIISPDQYQQYANTYRSYAESFYVPEGESVDSPAVLEGYKRGFFESQVDQMLVGCEAAGDTDSHVCNQLEYLNQPHIVKNLSQDMRQRLETAIAQLSEGSE